MSNYSSAIVEFTRKSLGIHAILICAIWSYRDVTQSSSNWAI